MDDGTVRSLLAHALPDQRVTAVAALPTGNTKRTFAATLASGCEVVVQFCPVSEGGLGAEPLLARAVAARTDVPVAPVLAVGEHDGLAYLVTERVPGEDLHAAFVGLAPAAQDRVVATLGRSLAALHEAFAFAGAGAVVAADGDLTVADPTDWPTFFGRWAEAGLDALPPALADLRGPVEAALADAPVPRDAGATLFPWDLRPGNALVRDETVVALLDWGSPLAGHAECSLAKAEYLCCDWYVPERADALRDAFYAGYESVRSLDEGYWSERRRPYRLAGIVHSAVDSHGRVTQPGYPPVDAEAAAAFHRRRVEALR